MKILLAAGIFPPQAGGPATYIVALANALVEQGIEVKIVSHNPDSDKSKVNCSVYPVKLSNKLFRYIEYYWLLAKHAKDVDVIYAMGPVNSGWPALRVAKNLNKKLVVKVVGDYAWEQYMNSDLGLKISDLKMIDEFQKHGEYSSKIEKLRKIEREVVRTADKVIVPSNYLKKIVEGWGAKNVEVVYNEIKHSLADPIKHDGEKWMVSVGRLMSWKGMDTLIEVISDLSNQFPESGWKLKIIGDGPEFQNLKFKIKNYKLDDVVELTGNLSNQKALVYMASADVFVLNSAYEGYSHVLIEAMNQGVPVLASNAGGNREVVSTEGLFEYNNKEEIKKKVLLYSNLGKGKSISHRFGLTDMISKTREVLENVIE